MKNLFIGFDLGGTKLNCAASLENGEILIKEKILLKEVNTSINELILEKLEEYIEFGRSKGYQIKKVGMGIPGVYTGKGIELNANIKGLDLIEINQKARDRYNLNFTFMNDVRCAALGEKWLGAARNSDNFIYVNLGTGLSIAIFANGQLLTGNNNAAGEAGYCLTKEHALEFFNKQEIFNENYGPLEKAVSGCGLDELSRKILFNQINGDVTAQNLFHEARKGNKECIKAVDNFIIELSLALINISIVINPESIVFGGSVSKNFCVFAPVLRNRLLQFAPYPPKLVEAELGDMAGVTGALYLNKL